jgi:hypothetical protein
MHDELVAALSLSAHLAELTGNSTYSDSALLSANFLRDILSDQSGLIYFGIDLGNCSVNKNMQSINSGFAIHAWSVIADIHNDDEWRVA